MIERALQPVRGGADPGQLALNGVAFVAGDDGGGRSVLLKSVQVPAVAQDAADNGSPHSRQYRRAVPPASTQRIIQPPGASRPELKDSYSEVVFINDVLVSPVLLILEVRCW
ncbi:hypothetical protein [Streptomyces sp. NPDC023327]|uniref:hypothetical protein n=1 Tax=Streptomyces sp. NPDC023327 TaxID=3157088 RepID=UPI0034065992